MTCTNTGATAAISASTRFRSLRHAARRRSRGAMTADGHARSARSLNETTEPVARYLRERDLASGVTIPIHMPRGGYATVTGIRPGSSNGDRPRCCDHCATSACSRMSSTTPPTPIYDCVGTQPAPAGPDRARARMPALFRAWPVGQGDLADHRAVGADGRHASECRREEAGRQEPHAGRRARRAFPPARRLT